MQYKHTRLLHALAIFYNAFFLLDALLPKNTEIFYRGVECRLWSICAGFLSGDRLESDNKDYEYSSSQCKTDPHTSRRFV